MSYLVAGQRLFVTLMAGTVGIMTAFLVVVWYIFQYRLERTVLLLGVMAALTTMSLLVFGFGGLVYMLWKGKIFPLPHSIANMTVNLLFPMVLQVGRIFGFKEDRIKSSFIEVNNQLVTLSKISVKPDQLLVLIPHCIQYHGCQYKVTKDIRNCKHCGKCQITNLLRLKDDLAIEMAVVTGGTLARSYLKKYNPSVVVAIACERDLTSGILDSYPLPVYGIINERPKGPCQDTRVALNLVSENIFSFIERR